MTAVLTNPAPLRRLTPALLAATVTLCACRPATRDTPTPAEHARKWLQAVRDGDTLAAIHAAEATLADDHRPTTPPKPYPQLFENEGVSAQFLTAPFNHLDYNSWREALLLRDLARQLAADAADPVTAIVHGVSDRIRDFEKNDQPYIDTPWRIWQRGWGLCDRQAWLAAEMLHQLGYETQVVYLRRDGTTDSPHTIAEIRRNHRVWTADPFRRICLPDCSVAQLARDPERLKTIWPDRPDWHAALRHAILYTPSPAPDYCPRNQRLRQQLAPHLGERMPRFGRDPRRRLDAYHALRNSHGNAAFPMSFWHVPIRVLGVQANLAWEQRRTP